jgi:putative ABC transport system permease protein
MRVFRLLGLRRLRHQPLRGVLAVVSVAGGVSLAVAILVTTASIDGSVRHFGRTLAGPAELRIVGATDRGGLSLGSVAAAEQVDGVTAVVPVVQAVALVDRLDTGIDGSDPADGVEASTALVLGVDCRAVALLGAVPCDDALLAAAGDRPLAMSAGVVAAAGDAPSLRTEAGRVDLTGVPTVESLGGFGGGATVVFSLQAAQARFGRVGVDVAYVVLEEAADLGEVRRRIETVLPPQDAVLGRDDPPPVVEVGLAGFLPLFNMLGLFGFATAVILVRNTVTLSLAERRRSLAVVGALGAAPRTMVGGVVGEAALLGGIGGAMGVGLGVVLAGPIVASLSGFTESVVGIPLDRQVPGSIAVVGLLLGASAGAVAAWRPARRSVRLDVAAELSGRAVVDDARPPRLVRGLALALGLLGVGVGLCWLSQRNGGLEPWQLSVGPLGFLLAAVATFLSGTAAPLLLRKAAHLTRGTSRAPLRLAFANIVREPRRAGIMAVAIASPVVVGFTTDGFVASARAAITESFERNDDFVSISTVDPGDGSVGFLSPELFAAAEALPEVERVSGARSSWQATPSPTSSASRPSTRPSSTTGSPACSGAPGSPSGSPPARSSSGPAWLARPARGTVISSPWPRPRGLVSSRSSASWPTATSVAATSRPPTSSSSRCSGHPRSASPTSCPPPVRRRRRC